MMKRTFLVTISIMILLFSVSAQAQLHTGLGAKIRNEIPYFNILLAMNNNLAELAWATQHLKLDTPEFRLETRTEIFAPLVKVFLLLDGPISPFVGLGGMSISTQAVGFFKGRSIKAVIKKKALWLQLAFLIIMKNTQLCFLAQSIIPR